MTDVIRFDLQNPPSILRIARENEMGIKSVEIDFNYWLTKWPDLALRILVKSPDGSIYIPEKYEVNDSILTWHICESDTAISGVGMIELSGESEDKRVISETIKFSVSKRMSGVTSNRPTAAESWVNKVLDAKDKSEKYALDSKAFSELAYDYADTASSSSEKALSYASSAYDASMDAKKSSDKILNLTADATLVESDIPASANYNTETGIMHFDIPRGMTGKTGKTPEISIGVVETVDSYENAFASITGSAEEPILNLGLPRGPKGNNGDTIGAIKNIVSGAGVIIEDSSNYPLEGLILYGISEQTVTTGSNLLDISKVEPSELATWYKLNNEIHIPVDNKSTGYTTLTLGEICPELVAGETYYMYLDTVGIYKNCIGFENGSDPWIFGNNRIITNEDLTSTISFYIDDASPNYGGFTILYKTWITKTQNATYEPYSGGKASPSPDNPQEILSTGDDGGCNIAVINMNNTTDNKLLTCSTPNGLYGIMVGTDSERAAAISVSAYANYINANGQRWICDELDFKAGVYKQRIGKTIIDGTETKFILNGDYWHLPGNSSPMCILNSPVLSKYFNDLIFMQDDTNAGFTESSLMAPYFSSVDELNLFCQEKYESGDPVILYYPMKEAIETPLPQEVINFYKSIKLYYPVTVVAILSIGAVAVEYIADTKLYIDNKIKELTSQIANAVSYNDLASAYSDGVN